MVNEIKIDREFRFLLPILDEKTYALLEENLLKNGCSDPVVVWDDTLIDGFNRYEICMKYGIPFSTVSMDFSSRDEALIWIISTQVTRRNLTPIQLSYFRGLHYKVDKRHVTHSGGRNQYSADEYKNDVRPEKQCSAARLSAHYNVSPVTIKRDAKVAEAICAIGDTSPEAKSYILAGRTNITRKHLNELLNGSEFELKYTATKIKDGVFERKAHHKKEEVSYDSLVKAGELVYHNPISEDAHPHNVILIRITEGFLSDLHKFVNEGCEAGLRKALKAYIDVLEVLHGQM